MNYITQINAFWRYEVMFELTPSASYFYLRLLNKNNELGWLDFMTLPETIAKGRLSHGSFIKARQLLIDKGLIKYKKRGANRAPVYQIPELSDDYIKGVQSAYDYTSDHTSDGSSDYSTDHTSDGSSDPLTKLNQTKLKDSRRRSDSPVFDLWESLWGFPNAIAREDLFNWVKEFGDDLVSYVITYAAKHNVKAKGANTYLDRALEGYRTRGITTVEQAKSADEKHRETAKANMPASNYSYKPQSQRLAEPVPEWYKRQREERRKRNEQQKG